MTTRHFTNVGRYVDNHIPATWFYTIIIRIPGFTHKHTVLSLKYNELTIVINYIS